LSAAVGNGRAIDITAIESTEPRPTLNGIARVIPDPICEYP